MLVEKWVHAMVLIRGGIEWVFETHDFAFKCMPLPAWCGPLKAKGCAFNCGNWSRGATNSVAFFKVAGRLFAIAHFDEYSGN